MSPKITQLILVLLIWICSPQLQAQQMPATTLNEVRNHISQGNAEKLYEHLNENVEVTLLNSRKDYAKSQAKFVLKQFFSNYPPSGFSISHHASSGKSLYYALGEYRSSKGQMVVNIFFKIKDGKYLIDRLRFDKK